MKRTFLIVALAVMVLSACSPAFQSAPAEPPSVFSEPGMGGAAPELMMESTGERNSKAADSAALPQQPGAAPVPQPDVQDRLVIQNADVTVVVSDPKARMDEIARLAASMGGFVVSSNLSQRFAPSGIKVPDAAIVIRVPALKLDEALTQIKTGAVEVQNENRSGQDVTQQYVDLKSRLKNLEAAEAQLTRIMEAAEKTEDVLNVFNQLTYYREQIEVTKGQINYFEEAAALSAISVRLIAEEQVKPLEIAGWKPQGVARDAIQDLIFFMQDFVDFMIRFVLNFLPKLLVIGLFLGVPFWLLLRWIRNSWRKSRAPKSPPPPPPAE